MKSPLRFDPRIDLREKTDIFNVNREVLGSCDYFETAEKSQKGKTHIDVILADVSFVSLRKVLLHAKYNIASLDTDFLVMLKPQFEAKSFELKKGIVKNEKIRRDLIKDFEQWLKSQGFIIVKKRDNDFAGKNGNLERFYLLKLATKY
jgi:23S rRNA (cytidine1920-2'-O)/16S rRNA (cytidine1409-2'-O)-methyltransferase